MTGIVMLRRGDLRVSVAPGIGGGITAFRSEAAGSRHDWLRPATDEVLAAGDVLGLSCFPLVPFSNRIRDGRFHFDGRDVALPANMPPGRHAIHGFGWQRAWDVLEKEEAHCLLGYDHVPDAWPYAHRVRQHFTLSEAGLSVDLAVENTGDRAMPAGIGFHPHFPTTPGCRVTSGAEGFWRGDEEVMPLDLVVPPQGLDPREGLVPAGPRADNCYTGWDRRAVIDWPERGVRLVLEADPPFDFAVYYVPGSGDYFCFEPVSTCIDAFNLMEAGRGDTGTAVLLPGQTIAGAMRLRPALGRCGVTG
jgi:aldose 1-epimerase